ncbi:hypothetical protein Pelo_15472 [Pelomyxa schiedti]|nr:hypothetical protein Pelo_15472 [Pelomyxa schiedti]
MDAAQRSAVGAAEPKIMGLQQNPYATTTSATTTNNNNNNGPHDLQEEGEQEQPEEDESMSAATATYSSTFTADPDASELRRVLTRLSVLRSPAATGSSPSPSPSPSAAPGRPQAPAPPQYEASAPASGACDSQPDTAGAGGGAVGGGARLVGRSSSSGTSSFAHRKPSLLLSPHLLQQGPPAPSPSVQASPSAQAAPRSIINKTGIVTMRQVQQQQQVLQRPREDSDSAASAAAAVANSSVEEPEMRSQQTTLEIGNVKTTTGLQSLGTEEAAAPLDSRTQSKETDLGKAVKVPLSTHSPSPPLVEAPAPLTEANIVNQVLVEERPSVEHENFRQTPGKNEEDLEDSPPLSDNPQGKSHGFNSTLLSASAPAKQLKKHMKSEEDDLALDSFRSYDGSEIIEQHNQTVSLVQSEIQLLRSKIETMGVIDNFDPKSSVQQQMEQIQQLMKDNTKLISTQKQQAERIKRLQNRLESLQRKFDVCLTEKSKLLAASEDYELQIKALRSKVHTRDEQILQMRKQYQESAASDQLRWLQTLSEKDAVISELQDHLKEEREKFTVEQNYSKQLQSTINSSESSITNAAETKIHYEALLALKDKTIETYALKAKTLEEQLLLKQTYDKERETGQNQRLPSPKAQQLLDSHSQTPVVANSVNPTPTIPQVRIEDMETNLDTPLSSNLASNTLHGHPHLKTQELLKEIPVKEELVSTFQQKVDQLHSSYVTRIRDLEDQHKSEIEDQKNALRNVEVRHKNELEDMNHQFNDIILQNKAVYNERIQSLQFQLQRAKQELVKAHEATTQTVQQYEKQQKLLRQQLQEERSERAALDAELTTISIQVEELKTRGEPLNGTKPDGVLCSNQFLSGTLSSRQQNFGTPLLNQEFTSGLSGSTNLKKTRETSLDRIGMEDSTDFCSPGQPSLAPEVQPRRIHTPIPINSTPPPDQYQPTPQFAPPNVPTAAQKQSQSGLPQRLQSPTTHVSQRYAQSQVDQQLEVPMGPPPAHTSPKPRQLSPNRGPAPTSPNRGPQPPTSPQILENSDPLLGAYDINALKQELANRLLMLNNVKSLHSRNTATPSHNKATAKQRKPQQQQSLAPQQTTHNAHPKAGTPTKRAAVPTTAQYRGRGAPTNAEGLRSNSKSTAHIHPTMTTSSQHPYRRKLLQMIDGLPLQITTSVAPSVDAHHHQQVTVTTSHPCVCGCGSSCSSPSCCSSVTSTPRNDDQQQPQILSLPTDNRL